MIILGITGSIGHGKSSLADLIKSSDSRIIQLESSEVISQVANQLNSYFQPNSDYSDLESINVWLAFLPKILKNLLGITTPNQLFVITQENLAKNPNDYNKLFEYLKILKLKPHMAKDVINQDNKNSYRPILQWIGGMCAVYIPEQIWFNELSSGHIPQKKTER